MRTRTKVLVGALICYGAAAFVEQFTTTTFYYSRLTSSTHVEDKVSIVGGAQVFALQVEKPITRWVPLVKYGETVYFHQYRYSQGANAPVERDATTRTRLLVVGLCSAKQYEQLAIVPYEAVHRDYMKQ